MKAAEKGTDRVAEVYLLEEGKVTPLDEYGEHVDLKDKAICCYVPVGQGSMIRLGGSFSGVTLTVAHDALIDGVYRKSCSYTGKQVQNVKRKLDIGKFLFTTEEGVIDTEARVAPFTGSIVSQADTAETIGTVELRLYITRQLGVDHALGPINRYGASNSYKSKGPTQVVDHSAIPPTFHMRFNEDAATLDKKIATREQSRMNAKRPGEEPWAIFRFYYRSRDTILEHGMTRNWNPTTKAPRMLTLGPVPMLSIGSKLLKDDRENSTRASGSPMPAGIPPELKDNAHISPNAKHSETLFLPEEKNSKQTNDVSHDIANPGPTDTQSLFGNGYLQRKEQHKNPSEKLRTGSTGPSPLKQTTNLNNQSGFDETKKRSVSVVIDSSNKHVGPLGREAPPTVSLKPLEQAKVKETSANTIEEGQQNTGSAVEDPGLKASRPALSNMPPTARVFDKQSGPSKPIIDGNSSTPTPLLNEPLASSALVANMKPAIPDKNAQGLGKSILKKRTTDPTSPLEPETKRAKSETKSTAPSTPKTPRSPTTSRFPSDPITPKPPLSMERHLAEQRRKLAAIRQRRLDAAKKQEALDEEIAPYKKRMAEELERLEKEMKEEESAYAEEVDNLAACEDLIAEFKGEED